MTKKLTYEELAEQNRELKKSIADLQYKDNLFRVIFEHAPIGILHFDQFGVITACNENFVNIIGSSEEKLVGLNLKENMSP